MPLFRNSVAGDDVKIFALPPGNLKFRNKFIDFAHSDSIFGYDVETTAIDEDQGTFDPAMRLRMVQFGTADAAWCLDAHDPYWRPLIVTMLRGKLRRFVSHTNYDALWAHREFGIDLADRALDTLVIASLLYPGERVPKGLKALCDRHIDRGLTHAEEAMLERFKELAPALAVVDKNGKTSYRKPMGKHLKAWGFTNIALDDEAFGQYGGLDAIYVRRLLDILAQLVKAEGMAKLSRREQKVARMATSMQTRGMLLDKRYTESLLRDVSREYLGADEWLTGLFGFSPRSPKRSAWLYDNGVTVPKDMQTKTGLIQLDKESLPLLASKYQNDASLAPVFEKMLMLSTRKNLYDNLRAVLRAADKDGFVHPTIRTQMAVTGRMSITSPAMQTFKKEGDKRLRGCFVAIDGHTFVGADYDSQEIRLAAAFSKDPALLKIIDEGLNQHDLTAAMIFGPDFTPRHRQIAKILNFAQQYGAGPKKIALQLGVTLAEAKRLWLAWRKAYATLVAWTDYMSRADIVVNPWDRAIPADPHRRYANGNYAIQSSGRDLLGDAMVALCDAGWGQHLWLPIHDEIVLQVPAQRAEEACQVLERSMFAELQGVKFTASAGVIGQRWNGQEAA